MGYDDIASDSLGVRKCGDADGEFFLQVPILKKEVSISALSEENFTEVNMHLQACSVFPFSFLC